MTGSFERRVSFSSTLNEMMLFSKRNKPSASVALVQSALWRFCRSPQIQDTNCRKLATFITLRRILQISQLPTRIIGTVRTFQRSTTCKFPTYKSIRLTQVKDWSRQFGKLWADWGVYYVQFDQPETTHLPWTWSIDFGVKQSGWMPSSKWLPAEVLSFVGNFRHGSKPAYQFQD